MKLISLLSGGIDSPVASYEMIKKGNEIIFVHFYNNTTNRDKVRDKIKDLVHSLSKHQRVTKLYMVPFKDLQKEIINIS